MFVLKQRRSRQDSLRISSASFQYYVDQGTSKVCFDAFISVFNISVLRVSELKTVVKTSEDMKDKYISHSVPKSKQELIRDHISSFLIKEWHYLGEPTHYHLRADLNIKAT